MSQGIFPGAVVVRGADWRWGDQDGKPVKNSEEIIYQMRFEPTHFRVAFSVKKLTALGGIRTHDPLCCSHESRYTKQGN